MTSGIDFLDNIISFLKTIQIAETSAFNLLLLIFILSAVVFAFTIMFRIKRK